MLAGIKILLFISFFTCTLCLEGRARPGSHRQPRGRDNSYSSEEHHQGAGYGSGHGSGHGSGYGSAYGSDEEYGSHGYGGHNSHHNSWGYYYDDETWFPDADHPQNGSIAPKCYTINVKIDHFGKKSDTFKLRYCCNRQFYIAGEPLFFLLGGNHAINKGFLMTGLGYDLAEQTKGIICFVEHRYFGDSIPFKKLSYEHLKYLTVEQALEDFVQVINTVKTKIYLPGKVGVLGCGYAGNLATYLRLKYPNLIDAAYVTCAPLQTKYDFNDVYEIVQDSISLTNNICLKTIKEAIKQAEELLETSKGRKYAKKIFNNCNVVQNSGQSRASFFRIIADTFVNLVRYGSPGRICKDCKYILAQKGSALEKVAWYVRIKAGNCSKLYDEAIEGFKSTIPNDSGIRQWEYIRCSQLGWHRNSGSPKQPFGKNVPIEYSTTFCYDLWGNNYTPEKMLKRTKITNLVYGGGKPKVTNVVFVYGTADYNYRLGYQGDKSDLTPVYTIKGGRFCGDLYTIKDSELPDEVKVRVKARRDFVKMLQENKSRKLH